MKNRFLQALSFLKYLCAFFSNLKKQLLTEKSQLLMTIIQHYHDQTFLLLNKQISQYLTQSYDNFLILIVILLFLCQKLLRQGIKIKENMINANKNISIDQNGSQISNRSESLEIVEPQNRIFLTSQNSAKQSDNQENDDILNYSIEQPSLSLNVVEQQDLRVSINLILDENQPLKRKRRQIFAKYKKNAQEISIEEELGQSKKFEETLEEVFNTKNPSKQDTKQQTQRRRFNKLTKKDQILQIQTENYNQAQQNRIKSQKSQYQPSNKHTNSSPSRESNSSQSPKVNQKEIDNDFSVIPIRISDIKGVNNNNNLDDSKQLQNMLQSPIFGVEYVNNVNNNLKVKSNENTPLIEQKNIRIHEVKAEMPKIVIQRTINNFSPTQSERQNAQEYQKIDITQQSISNSIMIRGLNFNTAPSPQGALSQHIYSSREQQSNNIRSPKINITYGIAKSPSNEEIGMHRILKQSNQNQLPVYRKEQNVCQNQKQSEVQQKIYQETRIPIFLRKARKANTYYPNFYHPKAQGRYDQQNTRLQILVAQFDTAISFLQKIAVQINQKGEKSKQVSKRFENGFRLEYFLNSGWQTINLIDGLEQLKPKSSFSKRPFDFSKVSAALKSYKDIVKYYKDVKLNLSDQRGRQKMIGVRKKFWAIEWNIRIVSEDLYVQTLKLDFPLFYHECLDFLKRPFPRTITKTAIQQRRYLTGKYLHLKHQKDPLANSQIGDALKEKVQRQMKFLCPY